MFSVPYTSFLSDRATKVRMLEALDGVLEKGKFILGPEILH